MLCYWKLRRNHIYSLTIYMLFRDWEKKNLLQTQQETEIIKKFLSEAKSQSAVNSNHLF